jgi:hypothetical protein
VTTRPDLAAALGNPFYAINIDPALAEPHQPLVTEDAWINANTRTLDELGPQVFLRNLLASLKGDHARPGGSPADRAVDER